MGAWNSLTAGESNPAGEISAVLRELPDLPAELERLIRQIGPGQVASYGQLATALGDASAARWVGHAVRHEIESAPLPLHRIVQADGRPGEHREQAAEATLARLAAEGVPLNGAKVDLSRAAARLTGTAPLARLWSLQAAFKPTIFCAAKNPPNSVAGVDVSYRGDEACACYVRFVSPHDSMPEFSLVHRCRVKFPYISGYLTFRELPPLLALIEEVRRQDAMADVVLVDGSGILHPRRAGIAAMCGAVADVPTIGVTKKLLVGRVPSKPTKPGEVQPVLVEGEALGHVLLPRSGTARPLYVSPGHQVSIPAAIEIARQYLGKRRLPLPIYWADRLGRQAVQA